MNLEIWQNWKSAKDGGIVRRGLMGRFIQENEALIQYASVSFIERSQYRLENLREDILQAARIGFMRGVEEWDPDRGSFTKCVWLWMRHEIQQVVRHVTPITRPKDADLPRKKQDAAAAFYAKHGREATPEEVGITPNEAALAQKAKAKFVPLHVTVSEAEGRGGIRARDGIRMDPALQVEAFAEGPEAAIDRKRDLAAMRAFLRKLSPADAKDMAAGKRPDLEGKAKDYVERRRRVRAA